jgi:hypothetical protein
MANSITIPDNVFYIIIAVIALIAIIFIVIQWRRVRQSKSQIKYLEKQAEHKKIEIVEKDLEQKRTIFGLPETEQEQLAKIINNTRIMLLKVGFLQTKLNGRIKRLEPSKDDKNFQKDLEKIEKKENEIEKKTSKEDKKLLKLLEEIEEKEKEIKKM